MIIIINNFSFRRKTKNMLRNSILHMEESYAKVIGWISMEHLAFRVSANIFLSICLSIKPIMSIKDHLSSKARYNNVATKNSLVEFLKDTIYFIIIKAP